MAGTLEITEDLCWMPAGWVFDNILEHLEGVLQTKDPALAELLLAAHTDENGGYLDLRDWDAAKLGVLLDAAQTAYSDSECQGAQRFVQPEFYEGFLKQFRQLCNLLHAGQKERLGKR